MHILWHYDLTNSKSTTYKEVEKERKQKKGELLQTVF